VGGVCDAGTGAPAPPLPVLVVPFMPEPELPGMSLLVGRALVADLPSATCGDSQDTRQSGIQPLLSLYYKPLHGRCQGTLQQSRQCPRQDIDTLCRWWTHWLHVLCPQWPSSDRAAARSLVFSNVFSYDIALSHSTNSQTASRLFYQELGDSLLFTRLGSHCYYATRYQMHHTPLCPKTTPLLPSHVPPCIRGCIH